MSELSAVDEMHAQLGALESARAASVRREMVAHSDEMERFNEANRLAVRRVALKTRQHAIALYRAAHRGHWAMPGALEHHCNDLGSNGGVLCEIVRLEARLYFDTSYLCVVGACVCHGGPAPASDMSPAEFARYRDEYARCHASHAGRFETITDTYVCRRTGLGHVCNLRVTGVLTCRVHSDSRNGAVSCLVSGNVVGVPMDSLPYWAKDKHVVHDPDAELKRNSHPKHTESVLCCMANVMRNGALVSASDDDMLALLKRRHVAAQSLSDYLLSLATLRVGLLFSKAAAA
jgi:hypothetical protein